MTPFVFSVLINNASSDPIGRERVSLCTVLGKYISYSPVKCCLLSPSQREVVYLDNQAKLRKSAVFSNSAETTADRRRVYAFENGLHGADKPAQGQQLAWVSATH